MAGIGRVYGWYMVYWVFALFPPSGFSAPTLQLRYLLRLRRYASIAAGLGVPYPYRHEHR